MVEFRRFIFLLIGLISFQLSAQKVYEIDTQYPVHDLKDYLEITLDESKSLSPEKVLNDSTIIFTT